MTLLPTMPRTDPGPELVKSIGILRDARSRTDRPGRRPLDRPAHRC